MRLKYFVKLFLPPLMIPIISYFRNIYRKPDLEYVPTGWSTVLKKSNGWDCMEAVNVERDRYQSYRDALTGSAPLAFMHDHVNPTEIIFRFHNRNITFAYVLALAAINKKSISILDYGGSLGHNYPFSRAVLPQSIKIDFHVKEVSLMQKVGKELNPDITWWSDNHCLERKYDLVVINGVLQYVQDWVALLNRLVDSVVEGGIYSWDTCPSSKMGPVLWRISVVIIPRCCIINSTEMSFYLL